jgi:cell division protein ZapA
MTSKHSVRVSILNEEFTIRTDRTPEQARAIAQYLDGTARQVLQSGGVVEANRAIVLAALRITGELFEERDGSREATAAIEALANEIRPLLPPSKRASEPA